MQLNIVAAALLCLGMVAAALVISRALQAGRVVAATRGTLPSGDSGAGASSPDAAAPSRGRDPRALPAWGELVVDEFEIAPPDEYLAIEVADDNVPPWTFSGMSPDGVRELMKACGLPPDTIDAALASRDSSAPRADTVLRPSDEVVLSLTPDMRAKLHGELARDDANAFVQGAYCFPNDAFGRCFGDGTNDTEAIALVRRLSYPRGNARLFADIERVIRRVPAPADRLDLLRAVSRQTAVLPRLVVRPDTDIDRLAGYWGSVPGVRQKDVRPLLEAIRRRPGGGTVSVLHLLPRFARERLYTFPMQAKPGEPEMDCNWSAMNFGRDVPDDRFADPAFTASYIGAACYQLAAPNACGDLVVLIDDEGVLIHVAVYIADDIVFTKNGISHRHPWMLMRMADMLACYDVEPGSHVMAYRYGNR